MYKIQDVQQDDDDDAPVDGTGKGKEKKVTLGSKCASCTSRVLKYLGGVPVKTNAGKQADGDDYTTSFYYWEFIVFFQKTVLQFMVIFMGVTTENQALQANLLLLVAIFFLVIQYFNSPYYKKSLNDLNNMAIAIFVVYIFGRVVVRSAENAETTDTVTLRASETGVVLDDEYKDISRASVFVKDAAKAEWVVMVPVLLMYTYSDITFFGKFTIHFFWFLLDNGKTKMFNFFTCYLWKTKTFRQKYMEDDEEETANGAADDDRTLNPRLGVAVLGIEEQVPGGD